MRFPVRLFLFCTNRLGSYGQELPLDARTPLAMWRTATTRTVEASAETGENAGLCPRISPVLNPGYGYCLMPVWRIAGVFPLRLEQPQHGRPFQHAIGAPCARLVEMRGMREHIFTWHGELGARGHGIGLRAA